MYDLTPFLRAIGMSKSSTNSMEVDLFQGLDSKKTLEWGQKNFGYSGSDSDQLADLNFDHLASFFKCILEIQSPFHWHHHYQNDMKELEQDVEWRKTTFHHLNSSPKEMSYLKKEGNRLKHVTSRETNFLWVSG